MPEDILDFQINPVCKIGIPGCEDTAVVPIEVNPYRWLTLVQYAYEEARIGNSQGYDQLRLEAASKVSALIDGLIWDFLSREKTEDYGLCAVSEVIGFIEASDYTDRNNTLLIQQAYENYRLGRKEDQSLLIVRVDPTLKMVFERQSTERRYNISSVLNDMMTDFLIKSLGEDQFNELMDEATSSYNDDINNRMENMNKWQLRYSSME